MIGYALRRVLSAIPIALIAITACFFILRLAPGGPFDTGRQLPPNTMANLRAYYNLDQPLISQYLIYLGRLVQGDLGPSMVYDDFSVSQMLGIGLPFTMMLGFSAFLVATVVGLIAGAIAGAFVPGRQRMGCIGTMLVGIVGGILGGFLWVNLLGQPEASGWLGALVIATVGAVIVLFVLRGMTGRD